MSSSLPLVSCICLTIPGREKMQEQAIRCFDWQTYPHRELVIVDDPGTIGAKRNMACSRSRGDLICFWDDDDLFAPTRLGDQVTRLLESGKPVTGYHSLLFYDPARQIASRYVSANSHYAVGVSLMFTKAYWREHRFPDVNVGEDNALVSDAARQIICVDGGSQIVARVHAGNTSNKNLKSSEYKPVALGDLPGWFEEFRCG